MVLLLMVDNRVVVADELTDRVIVNYHNMSDINGSIVVVLSFH